MPSLFDPCRYGDLLLPNRIAMPPLSLLRADEDGMCSPGAADWYSDRAGAGLIITEATQISALGRGYARSPGIYTPEHVGHWRRVTDAVHGAGGRIFLQLWHCGWIGHTALQPDAAPPIAPTDRLAADSQTILLENGVKTPAACSRPSKITRDQIIMVRDQFTAGAACAKAAGFDGVEIHGAAGYLLEEFMNAAVNELDGPYGRQTAESRTRFVLEIADAVSEVFGAGRVGIGISPCGSFHDMPPDPCVAETYTHLARQLSRRGIGHLRVFDQGTAERPAIPSALLHDIRRSFGGIIIAVGDCKTRARAEAVLADGTADLVGFGRPFITNPDLPDRLQNGEPLDPWDMNPMNHMAGAQIGYPHYRQRATAS